MIIFATPSVWPSIILSSKLLDRIQPNLLNDFLNMQMGHVRAQFFLARSVGALGWCKKLSEV